MLQWARKRFFLTPFPSWVQRNHSLFNEVKSNCFIIIQFQYGVFLVTEGGRMHLIFLAIALATSLHLVRFASSSTSNPILFTICLTCISHVCFCFPHFGCPFASSINDLFRTCINFILIIIGRSFSPSSTSFLGIESVWNHVNYWANMQDCSNGCKV